MTDKAPKQITATDFAPLAKFEKVAKERLVAHIDWAAVSKQMRLKNQGALRDLVRSHINLDPNGEADAATEGGNGAEKPDDRFTIADFQSLAKFLPYAEEGLVQYIDWDGVSNQMNFQNTKALHQAMRNIIIIDPSLEGDNDGRGNTPVKIENVPLPRPRSNRYGYELDDGEV